MAISSPGIGSGLDVNGIISKLMQVEQQPLVRLTTKEASYQAKISALGSLQGSVSTLNTALAGLVPSSTQTAIDKFTSYKASVADSSASVTASSTSVAGSYSFEVKQLATNHRITTVARAHILATATGAYADEDAAIAQGTLQVEVDGTTTNIVIDDDNDTLGGLAAAINATDAGITAEVADDGAGGSRLLITSNIAGTAGEITLSGLTGFSFDADTDTGDLSQSSSIGGQAAFGGYASADTAIAEGTLQITVGDGTTHEIEIDSEHATLAGLRDAINEADIGVSVTLSTVSESDVRLIFTSDTMGSSGKISMTGLAGFEYDADAASGDLSQDEDYGGQPAQGAIIKLNGVTYRGDSNTFTDALQGVTLTLSKVTTTATTLSISQDRTSALNTSLNALVKAYNEFNKTARDLGSFNADTKQGGALLGNATLRQTTTSIRNLIQTAFFTTGSSKRMSDLGVELQKDGSLVFTASSLTTATTADFERVAAVAAAFGKAADTLTDNMLGTKGSITAASVGAKATVKSITKQQEVLSDRLTQIESRYRKQFSSLDTLMASMSKTSSYLSQQLSNLPSSKSSS